MYFGDNKKEQPGAVRVGCGLRAHLQWASLFAWENTQAVTAAVNPHRKWVLILLIQGTSQKATKACIAMHYILIPQMKNEPPLPTL